jgi:hypothetical protein
MPSSVGDSGEDLGKSTAAGAVCSSLDGYRFRVSMDSGAKCWCRSSSGESLPSSLKWNVGGFFGVVLCRFLGRAPREMNAPGPFSSEKEYDRRWFRICGLVEGPFGPA